MTGIPWDTGEKPTGGPDDHPGTPLQSKPPGGVEGVTSHLTLRAVFVEDAVSCTGGVIASSPWPSIRSPGRQYLKEAYPGVTGIRERLVNFVGPGQVWIVARVDMDDDPRGAQVGSPGRGIEAAMRHESKDIYRVDIVPIGGGPVDQFTALMPTDNRPMRRLLADLGTPRLLGSEAGAVESRETFTPTHRYPRPQLPHWRLTRPGQLGASGDGGRVAFGSS